jgi:hypothetical protein
MDCHHARDETTTPPGFQLTASMRPPSHPPRPLVPGVGARVGATFDSVGANDWMENYWVGYFQGGEWCRKQDSNL